MATSQTIEQDPNLKITLIGTGTIGLSFAAFHLTHLHSPSQLTIYDPRPDLQSYIATHLPAFFSTSPTPCPDISKIKIATSLKDAVQNASIIQESTLENPELKKNLWHDIEAHASKEALLWSSTSGIPASVQVENMSDKSRVIVVHPYNPPHIMPLIELVPSPSTSQAVIKKTMQFWTARGRVPIHQKAEKTGFVANRLAFALLREAVHLVNEGVVSVEEVDAIVESSMGPRWAVAGPFKSYHAGGGAGGLEAFFKNIGGTVDACWADQGNVRVGDGSGWEGKVFKEAREAYGVVDTVERDRVTRGVLEAVKERKQVGEGGENVEKEKESL